MAGKELGHSGAATEQLDHSDDTLAILRAMAYEDLRATAYVDPETTYELLMEREEAGSDEFWALVRGLLQRDTTSQAIGCSLLAVQAERNPSTETGVTVAKNVSPEDTDAVVRALFDISTQHFAGTYSPDSMDKPPKDWPDSLESAVDAMMESGHPGTTYADALRTIAPHAIHAAGLYDPNATPLDTEYWNKRSIDGVLSIIAETLRKSDPEVALSCFNAISMPDIRTFIECTELDYQLLEQLMAGNFEAAHDILQRQEAPIITRLWKPMLERLQQGDRREHEWGNQVVQTIIEAQPDYFKGLSRTSHGDPIDIQDRYGFGMILGILGRHNEIRAVTHRDGPDIAHRRFLEVAIGAAQGLGLQSDDEGLQLLLSQLDATFTASDKKAIDFNYWLFRPDKQTGGSPQLN